AFSFISAGYITFVLIETPPLVSFYMNPTKVFLSYSHFLVAVPKRGWLFSVENLWIAIFFGYRYGREQEFSY
ncbi:hypothetical protein FZ085_14180, partial [Listeria monocytogenes]